MTEPITWIRYKRKDTKPQPLRCNVCQRRGEGYISPIYRTWGTPDHCYKCYRKLRPLLLLEQLVTEDV